MEKVSKFGIFWTLIVTSLTRKTLCDSNGPTGCTGECEIVIVLSILTAVCILIIVFFCIAKWKCRLRDYNSDLENMVSDESVSESSTRRPSIYVIERPREDLPPAYEMGLRTETPPPSFESLFPNELQCTSGNASEKCCDSQEKKDEIG